MSQVPFPQSVVSVASVVPESLGEGGLLQGHAPGAVLQYIAKLHTYQAVSQEKFGNKFVCCFLRLLNTCPIFTCHIGTVVYPPTNYQIKIQHNLKLQTYWQRISPGQKRSPGWRAYFLPIVVWHFDTLLGKFGDERRGEGKVIVLISYRVPAEIIS